MTRIINRQRALAEAGRLRLGLTVESANGKTRPTRSETWIFTSPDKEKADAAAVLWGGDVEHWQPMGSGGRQWRVVTRVTSIDAILPPGDPLSEAFEMWSKGGAQRRCDGATEQFSGSPCLCSAQFGEKWYEQSKGTVCDAKSRLRVLIPDLPGLGSYRMETGSYYASTEIGGMVDFIRSAVGDQTLVPVRLRIEQRTRVARGETKHFPVPVVELRGVTTGELLSGDVRSALSGHKPPAALAAPATATAISAAPAMDADDWTDAIADATTEGELRALWDQAQSSGAPLQVADRIRARLAEVRAEQEPQPAPAPATSPPSQSVDDVWFAITGEAGKQGLSTADLEQDFTAFSGHDPADATADEMTGYLNHLRSVKA